MNTKLASALFLLPLCGAALLTKSAAAADFDGHFDRAAAPVLVAQQYDPQHNYPNSTQTEATRRQEATRREAEQKAHREAVLRQQEQTRRAAEIRRAASHKVWVPGHWEAGFLGIGRHWVDGQWVNR